MAPSAGLERTNGLIAVLLITRSRPGPKLVFHYPPVPRHARCCPGPKHSVEDEDDSSSDSDYASEPDRRHDSAAEAETVNPLERVLGHEVGSLERLLSPGRWSEKKKFEICLDGVTFVGLPVFAKEDGSWAASDEKDGMSLSQSPHHARRKDIIIDPLEANSQSQSQSQSLQQNPTKDLSSSVAGITITAPDTPTSVDLLANSYKHMPDSFDSHGNLASLGTSMNSSSTTSGAVAEQMTMFHVVFALSEYSPPTENGGQGVRAADLYEHVAKKLSKALKYCQKRSNYVSTESRKLLALKQRGRAERTTAAGLWEQLASHSELAWALQEVYTRVSMGDIAGLRLDGLEMALQVPLLSRDVSDGKENEITRLSTILLLDSREVLVRALEDHRDASLLSYFIRESTSTKSLAKQAAKLGIPEKTIVFLARHLVKWRKARVFAPLHPRNLYIVRPSETKNSNAASNPPTDLRHLGIEYARRFPALPSMETMLVMLGSRPIKYGALIQSRDHRVPYMEILAWLVRHELVSQLRTVGWLRCIERTDDEESLSIDQDGASSLRSIPSSHEANKTPTTEQMGMRPMPVARLLGIRTSIASASDDGSSVASDQTAFPTGVPHPGIATSAPSGSIQGEEQRSELDEHDKSPLQNEDKSSIYTAQDLGIITNPLDPTSSERAAMRRIENSLEDPELRERFSSLAKYFDGEHSFEEIADREGLKRARVEEWIAELERGGWLRSVRCL